MQLTNIFPYSIIKFHINNNNVVIIFILKLEVDILGKHLKHFKGLRPHKKIVKKNLG